MVHVLILPKQGNTVESCVIQEWKVKEGEPVKADTPVCVVETDKATFEVPAGADGQVLKILHPEGDDVPVLQPLAVIGQSGEDWKSAINGGQFKEAAPAGGVSVAASGTVPAGAASIAASGAAPAGAAAPLARTGAISPRARNLAAREGPDPANITGSGPGGRIIERDVTAALAGRPPLTAAARAAALAGAAVPGTGSGMGGRVTAADMAGGTAPAGGAVSAAINAAALGNGAVIETPVKGVRKLIADRMLASLAESAQFTLNANAQAVRLQELRQRFKAGAGTAKDGMDLGLGKITINDLILYAVSRILPAYPFMNALKIGDTLKTYERVHLGMAVDTPRGLMVPVIRNANLLPLRQISAEAKRLASACQEGSIKPDELSGSTFTVSNLGSFGITGFTPVINAPEVAILGICGIELKPVETNDDNECGFAYAPHIGFSLTINHQVVDGAPAARFLSALCKAVADIDLLLAAG